jgi:hypothetical protein
MQDNSKTKTLAARAHPQMTTVFAAPLCGKHCPGPACFLARKVRSQDCEMDRMCGLMNEMDQEKRISQQKSKKKSSFIIAWRAWRSLSGQ